MKEKGTVPAGFLSVDGLVTMELISFSVEPTAIILSILGSITTHLPANLPILFVGMLTFFIFATFYHSSKKNAKILPVRLWRKELFYTCRILSCSLGLVWVLYSYAAAGRQN